MEGVNALREEKDRYWEIGLSKENYDDLKEWMRMDVLVGIVDEKEGGIIGYVNEIHARRLIEILNSEEIK